MDIKQIVIADQKNRVRIPMDFFRAAGINPNEALMVSMDLNTKVICLSSIKPSEQDLARSVVMGNK